MAAVHPQPNDDALAMRDEWDAPPLVNDPPLDDLFRRCWQSIASRHRIRPVVDIVNVRVWRGDLLGDVQHNDVWERLLLAWRAIPLQAKVLKFSDWISSCLEILNFL